MQTLTPDQFFALAGVTRATFKAAVSRGEAALAFGTQWALAGGTFLDLDVVAWLLVDELTPAFTRKFAAVIVKSFSDQWCEAVSAADRVNEPIFFIVIEIGEPLGGKLRAARREGLNVACGTLSELVGLKLEKQRTIPDRMTFINITNVMHRARRSARTIGLDLSAPFCPPLNDPVFRDAVRDVRNSRERNVARIPHRFVGS